MGEGAMTDEFLIGDDASADPADWSTVESLLAGGDVQVTSLAWTHEDFSRYEKLSNGHTTGLGYPVVTWTFRALSADQREALRDFCPGLSADVYIRTPTNETVAGVRQWKDYLCIMHWVERSEIVDFAYVEQVELRFTHCEEQ